MKIFNYLAVIPARKKSKRIKNKNLSKVKNQTLVEIAIDQALKVRKIDYIAVSSDSEKIINIAKKRKILSIKRPYKYSTDNSPTEDVLNHAIFYLEKKNFFFKNIILLQPTSPQRTFKDIKSCMKKYEKNKINSIFSGYYSKEFVWKINNKFIKSFSYNYLKRQRSQDIKPLFYENGAIYIFNCNLFKKKKNRIIKPFDIFEMSKNNSIDIDTKEDLDLLNKILI